MEFVADLRLINSTEAARTCTEVARTCTINKMNCVAIQSKRRAIVNPIGFACHALLFHITVAADY